MNFVDDESMDFLTYIRGHLLNAQKAGDYQEFIRLSIILRDTLSDTVEECLKRLQGNKNASSETHS